MCVLGGYLWPQSKESTLLSVFGSLDIICVLSSVYWVPPSFYCPKITNLIIKKSNIKSFPTFPSKMSYALKVDTFSLGIVHQKMKIRSLFTNSCHFKSINFAFIFKTQRYFNEISDLYPSTESLFHLNASKSSFEAS